MRHQKEGAGMGSKFRGRRPVRRAPATWFMFGQDGRATVLVVVESSAQAPDAMELEWKAFLTNGAKGRYNWFSGYKLSEWVKTSRIHRTTEIHTGAEEKPHLHVLWLTEKKELHTQDVMNTVSANRGQINGTARAAHSMDDVDRDSAVMELKSDHRGERSQTWEGAGPQDRSRTAAGHTRAKWRSSIWSPGKFTSAIVKGERMRWKWRPQQVSFPNGLEGMTHPWLKGKPPKLPSFDLEEEPDTRPVSQELLLWL